MVYDLHQVKIEDEGIKIVLVDVTESPVERPKKTYEIIAIAQAEGVTMILNYIRTL